LEDFRTMKRAILSAGLALLLIASGSARAGNISINFDTDASGSPINAPSFFSEATALTTLYSSIGVTFSGPGGNDGGAILNQDANFSIGPALSSPNFLAFNSFASMADGGIPQGPETISFATLATSVSIYAASGSLYTLTAFNSSNAQIAQDVVIDNGSWNLLSVSGSGIAYVTVNNASLFWLLDNLTVTNSATVPEPGTMTLLGLGAISLLGFSALRNRRSATSA
jgi:PEP-CTERM motif